MNGIRVKAYSKGKDGTLYVSQIDGNTTVPGSDGRWWTIYNP